jgi:hypothetical protein
MIRLELAGGGSVYFLGAHDYNVTITGHALLKIFFKVKPALIGGFGKLINPSILFISNSYLAGLIEGDGCINVPDPSLNKRQPVISICFSNTNLPFIHYLISKLKRGKLLNPKKGKNFYLVFSKYED